MDDVIVFSKNLKEHLTHLRLIFDRLKRANLSINLKKSSFAKRRLEYLGHIVSDEGIKANPEKVRAITDMEVPSSRKDVLKLSGLCSYLSSFIPNLAEVFAPISKLLRKDTPFHWGSEQDRALKIVKKILTEDILLKGIDYEFPLYLRTDASDKGMGAILAQEIEGSERVVAYASKKFKDSETRLSAVEKECKAILFGIKKFQEFLGISKFTVYTDNRALTHLKSHHPNNKNLTRWSHEIENWGCEIKYYEGRLNILADILSRMPVEDPSVGEPDHLTNSPEVKYVPTFALTYFENLIPTIISEQSKDLEIQEIIIGLRSSNVHSSAATALQNYVFHDGILRKRI
ncbi:unnamed protein product [Orchesella dallaii]|uniref:Reverse transcriptase domain-containing protein n=1 Tax=Orchesella dallaii TaxID=48710 RepID=A0ABP1RUM2_9HEXA